MSAAERIFAEDVGQPEGPAFGPDGSFHLVEMASDRASVVRFGAEGRVSIVRGAGRPNGLTIDGDGNLWVAEAHAGTVLCLAPDGTLLKRIDGNGERRFLWSNDLAFGPDGLLYLTDSGVIDVEFIDGLKIRSDFATVPYDGGVYQIDPVAGTVRARIDSGLRFANGIAFGPDGELYANETLSGNVYRYRQDGSGGFKREVFANVLHGPDRGQFRGPDGMAFDEAGYLYCAVFNQGEVTVIDPAGKVVDRLATRGALPTNVAFAPGSATMYITEVESSSVQLMDARHKGLSLHHPKF